MKSVRTYKELAHRLDQIVGVPFAELSKFYSKTWKGSPSQNKGWGGNMIDFLVGGDEGNASRPDISSLGIEVKSIPIDASTRVLQPTKVTALNYRDILIEDWWRSNAFHKLRAVLFVPIVKGDAKKPDDWYIRRPFLWLPSTETLSRLESDYDTVRSLVRSGRFEDISSAKPPKGQGVALHPKPSAADSSKRTKVLVAGTEYKVMPRAWMLRESFTEPIVRENLRVDVALSTT